MNEAELKLSPNPIPVNRGFVDLTGRSFSRFTVLGYVDRHQVGVQGRHKHRWVILCDCGKTSITYGDSITSGNTTSCGCIQKAARGSSQKTHGKRHTRAYSKWAGMKRRCYNKNDRAFRHYGGRGIKVCERWRNSFENFYEDMGDPPIGMTLERNQNDADYSPENCRWATWEEQARNKRNNRFVKINGERMTRSEANRILGFKKNTLAGRLNWNMPFFVSVMAPCDRKK